MSVKPNNLLAVAVVMVLLIVGCAGSRKAIDDDDDDVQTEKTVWRKRVPSPYPSSVKIQPGGDDGAWVVFIDPKSDMFGYEDKFGTERIEARFDGVTAIKFDHIMVVGEELDIDDDLETIIDDMEEGDKYYGEYDDEEIIYYLTKTGKVIGWYGIAYEDDDFDVPVDCEFEGFIRFRGKNGKAGMFDKDGKVAVPAKYNRLHKARNGLIPAEKYAGMDKDGDSLFVMTLIDTKNRTLIEDLGMEFDDVNELNRLNFYSVIKTKEPIPNSTHVQFKAKGGGYYSIGDHALMFRQWLINDLLANFSAERLVNAMFDTVRVFAKRDYYGHDYFLDKNVFAKTIPEQLKNGLLAILDSTSGTTGYDIEIGEFDVIDLIKDKYDYKREADDDDTLLIQDHKLFGKYFDNCGRQLDWKYPGISLYIKRKDNDTDMSIRFNFLPTDNGYKLGGITAPNDDIIKTTKTR